MLSLRSIELTCQGRPAGWIGQRWDEISPLFEMIENLSDDDRVFDRGDDFDCAMAVAEGFDTDRTYTFHQSGR